MLLKKIAELFVDVATAPFKVAKFIVTAPFRIFTWSIVTTLKNILKKFFPGTIEKFNNFFGDDPIATIFSKITGKGKSKGKSKEKPEAKPASNA